MNSYLYGWKSNTHVLEGTRSVRKATGTVGSKMYGYVTNRITNTDMECIWSSISELNLPLLFVAYVSLLWFEGSMEGRLKLGSRAGYLFNRIVEDLTY